MPSSIRLVRGSTNRLIQTLTTNAGDLRDGATVEVTLRAGSDDSAPEVEGVEWPVEMEDIGAGEYEYELPHTVDLRAGRSYLVETNATYGAVVAHSEVLVPCENDSD